MVGGLATSGYRNSLALYNTLAGLKNTNVLDDGPLTLAASTLTVTNNLMLFPTSVFNYTLGTNAATVAVLGNLALGGTNNLSAGPGFTNGTYTLMTYTGSLSGNNPVLGSAPTNFSYSFNTSTAGQVQLVVAPPMAPPAGISFSDTFGASTVNAPVPAPPTATTASYEILSGIPWSPTPAIAPGDLRFGIGGTSSGVVEAQAVFAAPPVTLVNAGDFIQLSVTFTDTAGILSQIGHWAFGLFNSGGGAPLGGGLNGTLSAAYSTAATGGARNWQGYVAQIAYTGGTSGFYDRKPQTGTANNNQDLAAVGTSQGYGNPVAALVGTASTAPSVTLTVGSQYTEVLTCTLTNAGALQLQSQLYAGSGTNGARLSTMSATTGPTPLTTAFDGLAIGGRAEGNTPSQIDVNSISVVGQTSPPPALGCTFAGPTLTLNWPANYLGWLLQSNSAGLATTNWSIVPGSGSATSFSIPVNAALTNVFYRLVAP